MNKIKVLGFSMLLLTALGFNAFLRAGEALPPDVTPELIAKGKALFNDKNAGLGVKFACILCHKGDKAISKADVEKAGDKLSTVINKYITERAKGPALAPDSENMKALMAYIRYEHSK